MKILYCGYRDWALKIYDQLKNDILSTTDKILHEITLVKNKKEFCEVEEYSKFDVILFIGWSWIVPDYIVNNTKCICLHPSKLPKYRGGSPLQNQIIDGVENSAVTFFIMDNKLDHGPILYQEDLSLRGNLKNIFANINEIGWKGLKYILDNFETLTPREQKHKQSTVYKRRNPEMSEIFLTDIKKYTAKDLFNKIRALQDPYPNAFIKCKDGTKLYLKEASYE
tara:strand:- start:9694 stop:10365 length:672 start_codon:yes stop_codon:yes gene_type:complete